MCEAPVNIKNPLYGKRIGQMKRILVPCNKCVKCLKKRAMQWSIRLHYENKISTSAYFVTLTYENPPRSHNGLATCLKDDLQKYFKRLRKREMGNTNIKYYACSEYGEQLQRPHYHIILFNVKDKLNIHRAWSVTRMGGIGIDIIGMVHVGDVTPASINYVSGYIGKKIGIPLTDYDDRLPEFSLMSKNMGTYYIDKSKEFHNETLTGYTVLDGVKHPLPRYYKNKIFNDETKNLVSLKNQTRFYQIEARKNKNYHDFLAAEKNKFEIAKLNAKSKRPIINHSKTL